MDLLVCVINQEEKLEDVLSRFLELGVTGATVIHSEGMGHLLSKEVPIFAGLRELMSRSRPRNTTIFSVIETKEKLENAIDAIQEVCGDFDNPATGIVIVVPVDRVIGLAPELKRDTE